MTKNMGTVDRVARIVLALVVAALYFTGRIRGVGAIVLALVAAVFLITGFTGKCPGYMPLGISTRGRPRGDA
jgi:DUF2892 family protein